MKKRILLIVITLLVLVHVLRKIVIRKYQEIGILAHLHLLRHLIKKKLVIIVFMISF